MKKIFLALLACAIGCMAAAQKIEKKTDDMSGETTVGTSWEILHANLAKSITFKFALSPNGFIIPLFKIGKGSSFTIGEGDELMLKLDNGELIKLAVNERTSSKWNGQTGLNEFHNALIAYTGFTEEVIDKLLAHKVVKYRFVTTGAPIEDELKDKRAIALQTALQLIKEEKATAAPAPVAAGLNEL